MEGDESCVNGDWVDRVCRCSTGHATYFEETSLSQKYCDAEAKQVVLRKSSYEPRHYLFLLAMTFTVLVTIATCVALATAVAAALKKFQTKKKIKEERHKLIEFQSSKLKRNDIESVAMGFWTPPDHFQCINEQTRKSEETSTLEAVAVAAYKPEVEGELELKPGMIIKHVEHLEKGWCKGVVGKKAGFFPFAFVKLLQP